ncbi:putative ABC-type transport system permease component [Mycoplasmoides gallisepticum NC08_2008.031-4-3P]|uniref:ABC transporter permease n=1 Tax=Mycoplasmoides gallisepticum TaxID=2096 RepID=UPI0002778F08|nr:ABC transporter permease [Mycoplasmoides gallisepticum]AFP81262.1 putative ABC-type transport system permease component [Mycoplasmoides gallisepticum NC08_2008.031-4-3P]
MKQPKQFWIYFAFLIKQIVKKPFVWATFSAYFIMLLVILLIFPLYQETSPANYWNNPVIHVSTFLIPVASIFGIMVAMFLFKDGVADGTEIIIISKPVSRKIYVSAKFLVLILTCLVFSFLLIITAAIAKINPQFQLQNMKDLMLGIFIGNFINSSFFGSISILISFGLSKNSTIVIVFLATFLMNFQTPLSALFFKSPSRVLSDSQHTLVERSLLTNKQDRNHQPVGETVAFQPTPSDAKQNIKQLYEQAEASTFYNQSFYFNLGNALNSIYNLNSLSYENSGNINFLSANTKIVFERVFDPDNFYNIDFFLPRPDEKGLLQLQRFKVFLSAPTPEKSSTSFIRISNPPSYSYLNTDQDSYTVTTADFDLYEKNPDNDNLLANTYQIFFDEVFTSTKNSQQRSIASLLSSLFNQYVTEIIDQNNTNLNDLFIKISPDLVNLNDLLRSPNLMYQFTKSFEQSDAKTNEEKAIEVYKKRVNLFYALNDTNSLTKLKRFMTYSNAILQNDIIFNRLRSDTIQNIIGNSFTNNLFLRLLLQNSLRNLNLPNLNLDDLKLIFYQQIFNEYLALYLTQVVNLSQIIEQIEGKGKKQDYFVNLYPSAIRQDQLSDTYIISKQPIVNPWMIVLILSTISIALLGLSSVLYYSKDYA